MAKGNRGGRPRTPTSVLKLHGGYRDDRHADRAGEPQPEGKPVMPRWLKGDAANCWKRLVPKLLKNKLATEVDTEALAGMCDMWGKYRIVSKLFDEQPEDKSLRASCVAFLGMFEKLAGRFGVTPSDRSRLNVVNDSKPSGVMTRNRKA